MRIMTTGGTTHMAKSKPAQPKEPERNTPVSFKLRASTQKKLKALAVDREVSMSDLIEWYCEVLVEIYAAHQLQRVSARGHTLVLASLDEPTYAELRAMALREGNTTWQVVRRAVEIEAGRRAADTPLPVRERAFEPPCRADAWAGVVAAVSAALRDGTDAVDAFYRTFPWEDVDASTDDAALLRAALAEADTPSIVQTRLRRMYKRRSK